MKCPNDVPETSKHPRRKHVVEEPIVTPNVVSVDMGEIRVNGVGSLCHLQGFIHARGVGSFP